VNTQGTSQRAPWGEAARATEAYGVEPRVPRLPPCAPHFPPLRERAAGPPPAAAVKYERIDGPSDVITLGDNDAVVFRFSGRPDSIWLSCSDNDAMVTLTSRLGGESTVMHLHKDIAVETFVARDTVVARNHTNGQNAKLSVVGKWAALDEPSSAY
jgi:hypothetical protein